MKRSNGFTLIELMVTVAIAALLMGIAVPSMRSMLQNNRVTSAANSLIGAYSLARSEAINRGGNGGAALCPSADGAACATWATALGWIVFVDANSDGVPDANGLVRSWSFNPTGMTFPGAPALVRFSSNGAVDVASVGGTANLPLTFAIQIPGCTGDRKRQLSLAATGRIRVQKVNCP